MQTILNHHSVPLSILPSDPKALFIGCALIRNINGGLGDGKSGTCSLCSSELECVSSIFSEVVRHDV